MERIIVLGGAFSTGKSTMMAQIEHDFGDKYRYIRDGGRQSLLEIAAGRKPEELSPEEVREVQRRVVAYYGLEEKKYDGRHVVADGSLIEAAAYSSPVFSPSEMEILKAEIRDKFHVYQYVKFPINIPIERDGVRHSDYAEQFNVDMRIDDILEETGIKPLRLLSDDFIQRYTQLLRVLFFIT